MHDRKVFFLILAVVLYSLYSVHLWFVRKPIEKTISKQENDIIAPVNIEKIIEIPTEKNKTKSTPKRPVKKKTLPYFKDACSIVEVFYKKPPRKFAGMSLEYSYSSNITIIGITIFLVVLALNAILDAIKVKEEERARRKENPDGYRRQSLAEFANKKPLRRDSTKFALQLFQIAESSSPPIEEEKIIQRPVRPYTRGQSTNSYLCEKNIQEDGIVPYSSANETPTMEPKLSKRQSFSKLIGARPVPMVRRSSFPALPLNPDIQAIMLQGQHGGSTDSDDEGDGKGRRVRIIRRY